MSDEPRTPAGGMNAARWISTLNAGDAAFVAGAAIRQVAASAGMSEAALLKDWSERAANDPDCQEVDDSRGAR